MATTHTNSGWLQRMGLQAARFPRVPLRLAATIATAMLLSALAASHLKPSRLLADQRSSVKIEDRLPTTFGDWTLAPAAGLLVNPQQNKLINALYAEVISRTYVNATGERLMLSISYGRNQSDNLQVHKPEVCYPAQGFQVQSFVRSQLHIGDRDIAVQRLETNFGAARPEPVTYWTTVGDHVVSSGTDKKLLEIRYALEGLVADGLLFRMSSIDTDSARAFELHKRFATDLFAALGPSERNQLFGSPP